ncbi:MAG: outer membrane beta-barrel family protein [Muribaculaceae bacterium]|nr:outer membrane beta-barrel family protein [Muribaculaceae bacterium]
MKKSILLLLNIPLFFAASAQQSAADADSICTEELSELVVDARMQNTSAKVSVYIPEARQKNMADNGITLLNLMSIPQLSVDPVSNVVKTAAGKPVAVFIDYVEASPQDICGLNPGDVKRVEYYHSPSDPRFSGQKHVINFIMQKYEWGGYTKVDAAQSFGVTASEASVYSMMKFKSMRFDIYAGERYNNAKNIDNETIEHMQFPNLFGAGAASIVRSNHSTTASSSNNAGDIFFRAIYESDKMQLVNKVGFNSDITPESETENNLQYNDLPEAVTTISKSSEHRTNILYTGQYLLMLPSDLSLDINANFEYGNNKLNSSYKGFNGLAITNDAHEKSCLGNFSAGLSRIINDTHSVRAYVDGSWLNNRINYYGSLTSQETYKIDGYKAGMSYNFETEKWSSQLDFGWNWQKNNISNYIARTSYPHINAEVAYSPSPNSQLLASYEYYETCPTASSTAPVLLQQDEFMYYAGNPTLKNSPTHELGVQGLWLPSNKWQLVLTGFHYNIQNRRVAAFTPSGPGGTMLRYYVNNGNYLCTMVGLNAVAKFFGGKLAASIHPQLWFRETTGVFAMRHNELTCTARLTAYFGNFYAAAWYGTPSHYPEENSGVEQWSPSQYQLRFGWGNGAWNIGISASNFLRSDWCSTRETLCSEYYDMSSRVYSPSQHMKFSLSAAFTFGYGKKVDRSNELEQHGASVSAILK